MSFLLNIKMPDALSVFVFCDITKIAFTSFARRALYKKDKINGY